MTFYKPVVKTAVGLGSIALFGEAIKMGKPRKKLIKPKKIVKGFTNILVGIGLLKPATELADKM